MILIIVSMSGHVTSLRSFDNSLESLIIFLFVDSNISGLNPFKFSEPYQPCHITISFFAYHASLFPA